MPDDAGIIWIDGADGARLIDALNESIELNAALVRDEALAEAALTNTG